ASAYDAGWQLRQPSDFGRRETPRHRRPKGANTMGYNVLAETRRRSNQVSWLRISRRVIGILPERTVPGSSRRARRPQNMGFGFLDAENDLRWPRSVSQMVSRRRTHRSWPL